MGEPDLTESAWRRAKRDVEGACRTTAFGLGSPPWIAVFATLSSPVQEGRPIMIQVAVAVLATAVAIILLIDVVLACQLAAAAVRQRKEMRQASLTLEDEILVGMMRQMSEELIQITAAADRNAIEMQQLTVAVVDFLVVNVSEDAAEAFMVAGAHETEAQRRLQARLEALRQITGPIDEVDRGWMNPGEPGSPILFRRAEAPARQRPAMSPPRSP